MQHIQESTKILRTSFFILALLAALLLTLVSPAAAQPATITDTTPGTAINDGTVNSGEYVGSTAGINSWVWRLSSALTSQLHVDSSHAGALNFGLISGGGTNFNDNDAMVIYIDTDNGSKLALQ
jgi:hypothetical protein